MTSLRQRMIEDMADPESRSPHPELVRDPGLHVCTPFQPVAGNAGPEEIRTYHLSDERKVSDERKAAGDQFDSHRYFCASLPLQSHSQEELDF